MTRPGVYHGEPPQLVIPNVTGTIKPDPDPRYSHNDILERQFTNQYNVTYTLANQGYRWTLTPTETDTLGETE